MASILEIPGLKPETLAPIAGALPPGHKRALLSRGHRGTAETIVLMQRLVANKKRQIKTRELLGRILNPEPNCDNDRRPCAPKDYLCYAEAIYRWVRDHILYTYDPVEVEFLESPDALLKARVGDCDSTCILLASLYESAGFSTQWVTICADAERPDEYSHVYTRVKVPHVGWVAADVTMPRKFFGWEAQTSYCKRYWPTTTDEQAGPIDESPSVPLPEPTRGAPSMSGLGRRHHHGHRGRSWYGGWGGWGPYYWGPDVIVVQGNVPTTDELAVVPLVPEDGLSGLGMNSTLESLCKAAGVADKCAAIERVLDGTAAQQLREANVELNRQTTALGVAAQAAARMPAAEQARALQYVKQGRESVARARQQVIEAAGKYNWIRGELAKARIDIPSAGLSGLDALPAVLPAVGLLVAIAATCVSVSLLIDSVGTAIHGGKSALTNVADIAAQVPATVGQVANIIGQTGTAARSYGDAFSKVAVVVGIGLAAYLAYKHRGDIAGVFKRK